VELAGERILLRHLTADDAPALLAYMQENGVFLDSELVGRIALSQIFRGIFQNAYLGYSIAERWNGQGLATEAVGVVMDFAFGDLGLHRVQAAVMPRNTGSIRVLEKNGFREEGYAVGYLCINGVWEDHRIFARTT
jgi:ribosomal-protein-alanine N-acetyltransferase